MKTLRNILLGLLVGLMGGALLAQEQVPPTNRPTKFVVTTFTGLPATPSEGMMRWLTDANSATFNATISAGSSTNHVLACYNGTNWVVC